MKRDTRPGPQAKYSKHIKNYVPPATACSPQGHMCAGECQHYVELSAERDALRAENARLREALEAILAYEDDLPPQHSMGAEIYKQARAALAQSKSI